MNVEKMKINLINLFLLFPDFIVILFIICYIAAEGNECMENINHKEHNSKHTA
jgi:hypothetical protein